MAFLSPRRVNELPQMEGVAGRRTEDTAEEGEDVWPDGYFRSIATMAVWSPLWAQRWLGLEIQSIQSKGSQAIIRPG